ncbi:MAG: T9SS type A sorting domain-containing protein [Candidatus Neomarinimicrobiota bacterium]
MRIYAAIDEPISICAIRISFNIDDVSSTTGNGQFLTQKEGIDCGVYTIDSPPHDKNYFQSQLVALDAYYRSVSYGKFGINIQESDIYPQSEIDSYVLQQSMNYYNPYNQIELQEERLVYLFRDALESAYQQDQIEFSNYDLIVVFHAGIGQDFALPFLDPTPEDIPSTYIDQEMIQENLNLSDIVIGSSNVHHGIVLPETQNHLLYDISKDMFADASNPCEYQYGLTGTLALMVGFAIGLPPLWNVNSGESRIGVFGLMDQGSNNGRGIIPAPPTAWSRIHAGWEQPIYPHLGTLLNLPSRSEGNIIKVNVRNDEYYLIENRINYVREDVSIDSIRYLMGQISDSGISPPYIEILQDSTGIEKDTNGVVIYVPNYDIGLPASGLLIWHVDESVISSSIDEYGINSNINHMGIDLEEADGAQDIGHPSIFLFNDPSGGYFGDMWFRGNSQFYLANPGYVNMKPEFGSDTYPSTTANDGSETYIRIGDIGIPQDTLRFSLSNSLIVDGYPQYDANMIISYDIDQDGDEDIFGGQDSLYLQLQDSSIIRNNFHPIISDDIYLSFLDFNEYTLLDIVENLQDSSLHTIYHYDIISKNFTIFSSGWSDSLFYPIYNQEDQSIIMKSDIQWESHSKRLFCDSHNYGLDIGIGGITIDKFGESQRKWSEKHFQYIAGIDLDLDASVEVLAVDSSEVLYAFNSELVLMAGFPINDKVSPPILSQDLFGDDMPEIIAKSYGSNDKLMIFDSKGNTKYVITMNPDDELIAINDYEGKSSIITTSAIYQFEDISDCHFNGNTWSSKHGDVGRSRRISLAYEFENNEYGLIRRSYCYPNPIRDGNGVIRIESNGPIKIKINIYDLAGYFIESFSSEVSGLGRNVTEWILDTEKFNPGVYFGYVEVNNQENIETNIIKIAVLNR